MFDKNLDKYIEKYQDAIPKEFNQNKLLTYLTNSEVDVLISVSNRNDGKTFGYNRFFFDISLKFGIKFFSICRHFTLRKAFEADLLQIMIETNENANKEIYKISELEFRRDDFYNMVMYKEKLVGIVSDLNQATDLKRFSAFTKNFPLMVYDEFIALEGDYLPDEAEKMITMYKNVDRHRKQLDYIHKPKLFLLGNSLNLDSPILAELDIFSKIDRQPINTIRQYNNIVMEMHLNKEANEKSNQRIFGFGTNRDNISNVKFDPNLHKIATESDIKEMENKAEKFTIKFDNYLIKVEFYNNQILLSSTIDHTNIVFVNNLNDKKSNNIFINEDYFDIEHYKKHDKGLFVYANTYTRALFANLPSLLSLKIHKCISKYNINKNKYNHKNDVKYIDEEELYIKRTKQNILKRLNG